MGVTRTSCPVSQPCFVWFKYKNRWHQVRCVRFISDCGFYKNEIELPDGTRLEVAADLLQFDKPVGKKKLVFHKGSRKAAWVMV